MTNINEIREKYEKYKSDLEEAKNAKAKFNGQAEMICKSVNSAIKDNIAPAYEKLDERLRGQITGINDFQEMTVENFVETRQINADIAEKIEETACLIITQLIDGAYK